MTAQLWPETDATSVGTIDGANECLQFVLEGFVLGPRACSCETVSCPKIEDVECFLKEKFHREEKLMEESGFPGLSPHRIQHIWFLQRLHAIWQDVDFGADDPEALHSLLTEWIVDHVNLFDVEFGRFLASQRGHAGDGTEFSMFS